MLTKVAAPGKTEKRGWLMTLATLLPVNPGSSGSNDVVFR